MMTGPDFGSRGCKLSQSAGHPKTRGRGLIYNGEVGTYGSRPFHPGCALHIEERNSDAS